METVRKELGRVNKLIQDFKAAMTAKSETHLDVLRGKRETLENLRANTTHHLESNNTALPTPDFTQLYGIYFYSNIECPRQITSILITVHQQTIIITYYCKT